MTTSHIIPETGIELCFVPIEGNDVFDHIYKNTISFRNPLTKTLCNALELPGAGWQLLSTLSDITEEKLEGCIPDRKGYGKITILRMIMLKLECYTENPYQYPIYHDFTSDIEWKNARDQWQQAQSRTFDNWAILVRTVSK